MLALLLVTLAATSSTAVASSTVTAPVLDLTMPAPPPPDAARLFAWEASFAGAAALVAAPIALGLGTAWGSAPSDLVLAALPALLLVALGPPAAAAGAAWWIGDGETPDTERFWPAFGIGVGAQVAAIVVAVVLGTSTREPRDVILFSVADAALLAGVTAGSMYLFRPDPDDLGERTATAPTAHTLRLSFEL